MYRDQVVNRSQLVYSVQRALKCLRTIDSDLCARYVKAWRKDLVGWRQQVAEIGEVSVKEALAKLRLASAGRVFDGTADLFRQDEAARFITAGAVALPRLQTMNQMPEHAARGSPARIHWLSPVFAKHPVLKAVFAQVVLPGGQGGLSS